MKAWDYDAVVWEGEVYCVGCLPDNVNVENEGVMPIFASSEWDSYPVCTVCHMEHDYVGCTITCKLCGDPIDRPGLCDICDEGMTQEE